MVPVTINAYISADMKMLPCSFDNQEKKWAVDLRTHTIKEAWESAEFEAFRNYFRTSCSDCEKRNYCMGGCPIRPEIVLCNRKQPSNEKQFGDESLNNLLVAKNAKGENVVVIPQVIFKGKRSISWKEDFDNKHKKRAGKGWFRYNTRFALPVTNDYGEIIEYNIYQAVLIVRYATDGKLYLYDIQNIKKKRDTHLGLKCQMVRNPSLLIIII